MTHEVNPFRPPHASLPDAGYYVVQPVHRHKPFSFKCQPHTPARSTLLPPDLGRLGSLRTLTSTGNKLHGEIRV